ncbi:amidohydrolase [Alishewanella sp. SMS8]|uniref:amidohydrolase n=1 Tax=Alishewanella sp. SMS8 TaxID=2994676 RepID=UPI0027403B61|nr:amidohydrolase [Alishewanella sp. SMS8]MDP5186443.1 amidohydrolase [Alishewanella sp.]MDP5460622.1 amidohydrolase [Alishewanella sp. SMS8]
MILRPLVAALLASQFAFMAMPLFADTQRISPELEKKVIEWRRDLHQHPELSNREFRTSKLVAAHLKKLGMTVQTDIAHTGVVAILDSGKPGPLLALRADMDGLPVVEQTDLPFRSEAKGEYRGKEVGVMHACGHDLHVAMLMGAAEYLSKNKAQLTGKVMFIFQPAEEGAPAGEEGGAELMLKEGLFAKSKPEAIFGIHVWSAANVGVVKYRQGPLMASSDQFQITVKGKQTHGSAPWAGVDPIVAAAQIVNNVQTIVSRQINITRAPAVVSFGIVEGGVRNNIIPDEVYLEGTIRNFDMGIRQQIFGLLTQAAQASAAVTGATADVKILEGYPVTLNDPALTRRSLPILQQVAGKEKVEESALVTGAEDFSFYALETPGLFVFLGVTPEGQDAAKAPANHSPFFYADEKALKTGTELYVNWALSYPSMQE